MARGDSDRSKWSRPGNWIALVILLLPIAALSLYLGMGNQTSAPTESDGYQPTLYGSEYSDAELCIMALDKAQLVLQVDMQSRLGMKREINVITCPFGVSGISGTGTVSVKLGCTPRSITRDAHCVELISAFSPVGDALFVRE